MEIVDQFLISRFTTQKLYPQVAKIYGFKNRWENYASTETVPTLTLILKL